MRSHQIILKENHTSGGGMLLFHTCHLNNIYTSPQYITITRYAKHTPALGHHPILEQTNIADRIKFIPKKTRRLMSSNERNRY